MIKVVVFSFLVLALGFIAIQFLKRSGKNVSSNSGVKDSTATPHNKKLNIKMMTYQEALEASKQFIYNITKAVMQRFTPDSQQHLIDLGKKLVQNGVSYLHVVDIAALSAEKERQLSHMQQKESKAIGIKK